MSELMHYNYLKVFVPCLISFLTISCNQNSVSVPEDVSAKIVDITKDASLMVNHENPGGADAKQGSDKLIDGDKYTKFLIFDYSSDFWAQQDFSKAVQINAYTVTAGNDAPGRDPKNWTLKGSNDGSTWEAIDTIKETTFEVRNKTNIYKLDSAVTYQSYRLFISANAGRNIMQVSEWRILHYDKDR